jgi:hypothetical protein
MTITLLVATCIALYGFQQHSNSPIKYKVSHVVLKWTVCNRASGITLLHCTTSLQKQEGVLSTAVETAYQLMKAEQQEEGEDEDE